MKHHLIAACLCLAPMSAFAEHGTQLAQWGASSPKEDAAPAAAPAADAPTAQPAATVDTKATDEKKPEQQVATVTAVTTPDQLANITKPSVNVSLDHYLGAGTFINAAYYASFSGALDMSVRVPFKLGPVKLGASARGYIGYEYTMPDTVNGRRWSWRDLSFGLSAPAIYKESYTGISITPSFSFLIPITPESWNAGVITVIGGGINLTRSIGRFDFAVSVSGSRGFHRWQVNGIRTGSGNVLNDAATTQGGDGFERALCRPGETLCSWSNTNNAWGAAGSASVNFNATDALSFSVSYALRTSWRYNIVPEVDQYTPKGTTADGNSVAVTGWAQGGDLVITSFQAYYQISDHWGVALFAYTAMPPRTQDGKNFRFPFWAFDGAANNYSSLGLSVAAQF